MLQMSGYCLVNNELDQYNGTVIGRWTLSIFLFSFLLLWWSSYYIRWKLPAEAFGSLIISNGYYWYLSPHHNILCFNHSLHRLMVWSLYYIVGMLRLLVLCTRVTLQTLLSVMKRHWAPTAAKQFGHDGHAFFVAGLENLALWDTHILSLVPNWSTHCLTLWLDRYLEICRQHETRLIW